MKDLATIEGIQLVVDLTSTDNVTYNRKIKWKQKSIENIDCFAVFLFFHDLMKFLILLVLRPRLLLCFV